jgi:hypothetical protein
MAPVTDQTPLTAKHVFAGYTFRTNDGRNSSDFFFRGHLTVDQVAETYFATFPEHRTQYPYAVDPGSVRHEWHLFTAHEDTCYLAAEDDGFDPSLCTCAARAGLEHSPGYKYRHPHPATPGQPGAIAVTWAAIGPA